MFEKKEVYEVSPDETRPGRFLLTLKNSGTTTEVEVSDESVEDEEDDDTKHYIQGRYNG